MVDGGSLACATAVAAPTRKLWVLYWEELYPNLCSTCRSRRLDCRVLDESDCPYWKWNSAAYLDVLQWLRYACMAKMGHVVPPVRPTEIVVPLPAWSVLDCLMKKQSLPLVQAMSFLVGCVVFLRIPIDQWQDTY